MRRFESCRGHLLDLQLSLRVTRCHVTLVSLDTSCSSQEPLHGRATRIVARSPPALQRPGIVTVGCRDRPPRAWLRARARAADGPAGDVRHGHGRHLEDRVQTCPRRRGTTSPSGTGRIGRKRERPPADERARLGPAQRDRRGGTRSGAPRDLKGWLGYPRERGLTPPRQNDCGGGTGDGRSELGGGEGSAACRSP